MIHPVVFTVPLKIQNIQSKHGYSFIKEVSYMFRLRNIAIIRLIKKTKRKNSLMRGFDVSKLNILYYVTYITQTYAASGFQPPQETDVPESF
jgi:glutamate formiminotransferase